MQQGAILFRKNMLERFQSLRGAHARCNVDVYNQHTSITLAFQSLHGAHVRCNFRITSGMALGFDQFQSLRGAHVRCKVQWLTNVWKRMPCFNRSVERIPVATIKFRFDIDASYLVSIAPGSACPLQLGDGLKETALAACFNRSRERMSVAT